MSASRLLTWASTVCDLPGEVAIEEIDFADAVARGCDDNAGTLCDFELSNWTLRTRAALLPNATDGL